MVDNMSELKKEEWLGKSTYEYEGDNENLMLVIRDAHSKILVERILIDDASISNFLLKELGSVAPTVVQSTVAISCSRRQPK